MEYQSFDRIKRKLNINKFPERQLQEAHKLVYNKVLADIISMVKHAAKKEEPILNSEERVSNALDKITESNKFNYEQLQWLGYIKEHLIQNLTLDEDDLKTAPVFEQRGGLGKARRVFGKGHLKMLIEEINYNMAA